MQQVKIHIVLADRVQKTKKEYKSLKETVDSRYIYQNDLDQACFQLDMAYRDFKDLTRRARHLILLKVQSMMDIKVDLVQWFIIFLTKTLLVEELKIKIGQTKR